MGTETMSSPEIFINHRPENQMVEFFVKHDGVFVCNMQFTEIDVGENAPTTLSLSERETQALMDRLWDCGFRPSKNDVGVIEAVRRHLEDMRKLVFPDDF